MTPSRYLFSSLFGYSTLSCGPTRNGPPGANLRHEGRNDAPTAAEHVAEAHRNERLSLACPRRARRNDHLGQTLRGPHHAGRVYRLVGRHVDQAAYTVLQAEFHDVSRTDNVVENRFRRGLLHQRHMLVRRRMKHDFRAVGLEDVAQAGFVTHVADQTHLLDLRPGAGEFLLNAEDAVFTAPEQQQGGRLVLTE